MPGKPGVIGEIPPAPGAGKFGPNAAWSGGKFIGQRTLVEIVDVKLEIERIALDTLDAYLALVKAAAADNVLVALDHYDTKSGTPSYKSTPVLLRASPTHEVLRRLVENANA